MSKKTSNILIISLIVVTIAGIVIGVWNYTSQDAYINEKTITLADDVQSEEMKVNLSGIAPGVKATYTLNLQANSGDSFDAVMDFEKTGADSLAPYIAVEILVDGESVGNGSLAELLDGKQFNFHIDFDGTTAVEVEIIYSMGLDVGDEAQGTSADFDMILTSTR